MMLLRELSFQMKLNNKFGVIYSLLVTLGLVMIISCNQPSEANQNTDYNQFKTSTEELKEMAKYNTWANEQIAHWLESATDEQWNREVVSSFNSLRLTLAHNWNAEHGWLTTLKKEEWTKAYDVENNMTKGELLKGFINTTKSFENFVHEMKVEDLYENRSIGNKNSEVSCYQIIQHVFNHATYHRGQLITIGRQVGLKNPPRTDFIHFIHLD